MCFLSRGPDYQVKSYKGYVSNGVKFQLSELSNHRLTLNNGVFLFATSTNGLSVIDVAYHGLLENIYELTCHHSMKIPLFEGQEKMSSVFCLLTHVEQGIRMSHLHWQIKLHNAFM